MKLLEGVIFGIILLAVFMSNSVLASTNSIIVGPVYVEKYQFPGDNDKDWKIVFRLYTSDVLNPNEFRIYGLTSWGNWRDITQDKIGESPAFYECETDFAGMYFNSIYQRYEVIYRMGDRISYSPPFCLGLSNPTVFDFYLIY